MSTNVMNKYIIPAILGAVVLMAGMFAFMPVQRAQTVHTSFISDIQGIGDILCEEFNGAGWVFDPVTDQCVFVEA